MANATIIYQADLIRELRTPFLDARGIRDWPNEITTELDPGGRMLVTMRFPHNDGPGWRVVAFAKFKGKVEPVEIVFTLPGHLSWMFHEVILP